MRRITGYLVLLLVFLSCETEINVFDPVASRPVAYCILNQDSDIQYLRLTKTYRSFDGKGIPASGDSLVYTTPVEAILERLENEEVIASYPFLRMESDKDSGLFPTDPFWVYAATHRLVPDADYRLVIYVEELETIVYSSCKSLSSFQILDPNYPDVRSIHMVDDHNPVFRWTEAKNAAMYQLGFLVHYIETLDGTIRNHEFLVPIRTTYQDDQSGGYSMLPVNSNQFYKILSENIPVNPAVQRKLESVDVMIQAGGEDLAYFIQQQEDADPFRIFEFTNTQNGAGVFSAISVQRINGFQLTNQSVDSLAYGRFTRDLNFVDRYGTRKDQEP